MIKKTFFALLTVLSVALNAHAFDATNFDAAAFQADQAKGEAILVDVYAKWCPTCKKQHQEFSELFKNDKYKGIKTYKLDYDNKKLVEQFSKLIGRPIPRQSTVVVFKGKEVISFSVAETGEKLKAAIDKAL